MIQLFAYSNTVQLALGYATEPKVEVNVTDDAVLQFISFDFGQLLYSQNNSRPAIC